MIEDPRAGAPPERLRLWPWIVAAIVTVALSFASLALAVLLLVPLRAEASMSTVSVAHAWRAIDQASGACADVTLRAQMEGHEVVPVLGSGGPWTWWRDVAVTGVTLEVASGCEPLPDDLAARVLVTMSSPACASTFVGGPWNRLVGDRGPASVTGCDGLSKHSQVWLTADGSEVLEGVVWQVADNASCIELSAVVQFVDADSDRWVRGGEAREICLGSS